MGGGEGVGGQVGLGDYHGGDGGHGKRYPRGEGGYPHPGHARGAPGGHLGRRGDARGRGSVLPLAHTRGPVGGGIADLRLGGTTTLISSCK